jgi:cytochrome c551
MKKKLMMIFMGASLVLAACGGGEEANEGSESAGAGDPQKLFTQKCSSCHGDNLQGGVGPNLQKIGSQLSQEEIEKTIAEGKGAMPPRLLEGEDAAAVAEWLAAKK